MGLNVHGRKLICEQSIFVCPKCKLAFSDAKFCSKCGTELLEKKAKMYANYGKNGITSISYKTSDGITINSKGTVTLPLGNGISYTS